MQHANVMQRVIFHLDMDAFYASIEQRDKPALRGKPVIVGAPPTQRGVVCAASYEARKFGVRSAMPSVTAGRLCPKGIFISPRMAHYREESRSIMEILGRTGALIEPMSIDEAYLDVGDLQDFGGDLKPIAGSFAAALRAFAFGDDDRPLETEWESKSISSEETFDEDTEDRRVLRATLWRQAREIEAELREKEYGAHTVQVKVRYSDGKVFGSKNLLNILNRGRTWNKITKVTSSRACPWFRVFNCSPALLLLASPAFTARHRANRTSPSSQTAFTWKASSNQTRSARLPRSREPSSFSRPNWRAGLRLAICTASASGTPPS
jgi:nucleotidyltransferase/DNA polymerase involved in DNA repair